MKHQNLFYFEKWILIIAMVLPLMILGCSDKPQESNQQKATEKTSAYKMDLPNTSITNSQKEQKQSKAELKGAKEVAIVQQTQPEIELVSPFLTIGKEENPKSKIEDEPTINCEGENSDELDNCLYVQKELKKVIMNCAEKKVKNCFTNAAMIALSRDPKLNEIYRHNMNKRKKNINQ